MTLDPIDLKLLGLEVKLYVQDATSPLTVTVSAQPGSGELLGNLLSNVAGLWRLDRRHRLPVSSQFHLGPWVEHQRGAYSP